MFANKILGNQNNEELFLLSQLFWPCLPSHILAFISWGAKKRQKFQSSIPIFQGDEVYEKFDKVIWEKGFSTDATSSCGTSACQESLAELYAWLRQFQPPLTLFVYKCWLSFVIGTSLLSPFRTQWVMSNTFLDQNRPSKYQNSNFASLTKNIFLAQCALCMSCNFKGSEISSSSWGCLRLQESKVTQIQRHVLGWARKSILWRGWRWKVLSIWEKVLFK